MNLYGIKGTYTPGALLAEVDGVRKVSVSMKPGNGVIDRGAICYKNAESMYEPAAAANAVDTNQLVVLDEAIDTNESATIASVAAAYREGTMIRSKVKLAADAPMTAAVEVVLRKQGIYLSPDNDAADFNNEIGG